MCIDDRSVRDSERKAALMQFDTDQVGAYTLKLLVHMVCIFKMMPVCGNHFRC